MSVDQMGSKEPMMLTVGQAAELLNVSIATVYAMVENGCMPAWKPPMNRRLIRIPREALMKMVESQTVMPA